MKKQHFNFKDYENYLPEHKKEVDSYFLTWFIGFSEGRGRFTSSIDKTSKNFFTIAQKDPEILYYIKESLGFGVVKQRKTGGKAGGSFFYYVGDQTNIDRLIRIFNGNILVEEVSKKFETWFIAYESYTKLQDKVRFIPFDADRSKSLLTLDNPWLCGFIDAEEAYNFSNGPQDVYNCFNIDASRDFEPAFIVRLFYDDQFIRNLRSLFGLFNRDGKVYWRFQIDEKDDLHRISNYFSVHKLRGKARLYYLRWRKFTEYADKSYIMKEQHFNFKDYKNHLPEHKKKLDSYFLTWFIGFSEGAGSFGTCLRGIPTNFFIIVQKDPEILYYIKENLGFGLVEQRKRDGYFFYFVADQINIDRLIRIFNRNILLEKVSKKFETWSIRYESYTKVQDKVRFIPFDADRSKSLLTLDNPWFCGLIDAQPYFDAHGFFSCFNTHTRSFYFDDRMRTLLNLTHVELKFTVELFDSDQFIRNLRSLFALFNPDPDDGEYHCWSKGYWRFQIDKKDDLDKISNYFSVHKLRRNMRRIGYLHWRRILLLKR